MTAHSGWRHIILCLGMEKITQYKSFIFNCPTVARYIHMVANVKVQNTVEFGIIPGMGKDEDTASILEQSSLTNMER